MAGPQSTVPEAAGTDRAHERSFKRIFLLPAVFYLLLLSVFPTVWSLGCSNMGWGSCWPSCFINSLSAATSHGSFF